MTITLQFHLSFPYNRLAFLNEVRMRVRVFVRTSLAEFVKMGLRVRVLRTSSQFFIAVMGMRVRVFARTSPTMFGLSDQQAA